MVWFKTVLLYRDVLKGRKFGEYFPKLWSIIRFGEFRQSHIHWRPAQEDVFLYIMCWCFVRNLAVDSRVASSTICRTGRTSRHTISMYVRAFNHTFPWSSETCKRLCALLMRWHGSNLETISWDRLIVSALTAFRPARRRRFYNYVAEWCANCLCSFCSWGVV